VWPVLVVVRDVLIEELFELVAVPDQGAVEQLMAHRSYPPFREGVRSWCPRRDVDQQGWTTKTTGL
jgi:hypothetical protein